ncbi:hypothetical protein [Streptomyces sp. WM6378]|uniref:hypothetical protein n=1 Tax=Streptomyces sp. WM6378 TaxID=1415557 RepID=UPI0006AF75A6|nr:hypothetical protein [Streptomyces sp. WM6378]KOU51855.1 hypothetical protein ADK54_08715 [Streptomyces sp. WM6378]
MSPSGYEPDHLYTVYELTESPETGENVPVVISWWHNPDPAAAQATAGAAEYREFIRLTRMHEHMAHYLTERLGGERTYLSLVGTRGRMRHHPLDLVLMEGAELPVPDPLPYSLGHALVHADTGVYVLVADPQPGPPDWNTLNTLVDADPAGVGMARFELRADDAARHHYNGPPPGSGPTEELVNRVLSEEDPSLREGLRLILGIPRPGERHI